jgi:hypothetical protein
MNSLNYKKNIALCLGLFIMLLQSCISDKLPNINHLKGYWKIDFITEQGEIFKPKSSALLFDHYSIFKKQGELNKVSSAIGYKFETSLDANSFTIVTRKKYYFLKFKTPWDEWSKKISYLDSHKLIIENDKRTFHYKRPVFIKFENE